MLAPQSGMGKILEVDRAGALAAEGLYFGVFGISLSPSAFLFGCGIKSAVLFGIYHPVRVVNTPDLVKLGICYKGLGQEVLLFAECEELVFCILLGKLEGYYLVGLEGSCQSV